MKKPAIVYEDVTVRYEAGGQPTLSGISLSIAPGERVALMGLNGSGKTTLLKAAVGLVPHEGSIRICGTPVTRRTVAAAREKIGFLFNVPEDQLLLPKVIEDVALGLLRRGLATDEAFAVARRTLDSLGMAHLAHSPVHHLSHGQKQRVALAGALVTDPSLLLLDEPSAGLDPPGKLALVRLLSSLDAAMLVATHDLDFAARICGRFIMLEQGEVVVDGPDDASVRRRWGLDEPV